MGKLRFTTSLLVMSVMFASSIAMDAFSSMATLRTIQQNQRRMLNTIDTYLQSEYERLADLRRMVENVRVSVRSYEEDVWGHEAELDNPITAYALIRDWAAIASKANPTYLGNDFAFQNDFPDNNDHLGGVRALLRLQEVYNLTTSNMASGRIRGHQSHMLLQKNDFFDLGTVAIQKSMYKEAVEWMMLSINHPPSHVAQQDVFSKTAEAHFMIQEYDKAVYYMEMARNLAPDNYTLSSIHDMYVQLRDSHKGEDKIEYQSFSPYWKESYQKLCRGEKLEGGPAWHHPNVWCEYRKSSVPYGPYKLEVISSDPWITMFYDILTDSEANMLKERAKPQLIRAAVGDPAKSYATEERVSKTAWLWDVNDEGNQVTKLSWRIQEATGLSTAYFNEFSHAEPFQVVNYGMGGQYEPHVDVYEVLEHLNNVPPFIKGTGDRVATFMFYLTDVKEGGATVFPIVKAYVPPVKNAAAFWYNIHRDGSLDLRTQHAGCPVLVGEKWVANKWIREGGQVFRRPCGLGQFTKEAEAQATFK